MTKTGIQETLQKESRSNKIFDSRAKKPDKASEDNYTNLSLLHINIALKANINSLKHLQH